MLICNGSLSSTVGNTQSSNNILSTLLLAATQCVVQENWPPDAKVSNMESFDFIIVGAGTAGCVIANRLSEVGNWKVLLIEAGADPPIESIIPALDKSLFNTEYDWNYTTTDDGRINQGNINEGCPWARGRMLGGCSSMNAMIYIKGNKLDYQNWYDAGNEEWHPDIVYKYFEKAESFQDFRLRDTSVFKYYGHDGPLVINTFNYTDRDITTKILDSWEDIGFERVLDINGPETLGAGIFRATAYNGRRESTAKAYLNNIQNRKNLKVIKYSFVTKILIKNNIAYGVEVMRKGQKQTYIANKEVIVSAGAINTPQLLMLSGIGPKDHLKSFNIDNVADLPVGKNLQDHIIMPVTIFGDDSRTYSHLADVLAEVEYLANSTGPLAHISFTDITTFYGKSEEGDFPKFQSHFAIFPRKSPKVERHFAHIVKYKDEVVNSFVELNKKHSLYMFLFNLLHPKSRGEILLQSTDPMVHPLIYSKTFIEEEDLNDTVEGIQILTQVLNTTYFKSINAFLGRMTWGPCNSLELGTDDYWKCVSMNLVVTVYHPVGTAKMGTNPADSVVDGRLRVHGVKQLRVIDASIMPIETSGNTNGPVVMVGERGSDLIKEDYNIDVSL